MAAIVRLSTGCGRAANRGRGAALLVALADDSGAGFDGYQSFDPNGLSLEERARGIDNQVQALWWAIISEFNLAYINPPPTFTAKSQRLRTPSDVLAGRRGTCIDLTLLLAACLQYASTSTR